MLTRFTTKLTLSTHSSGQRTKIGRTNRTYSSGPLDKREKSLEDAAIYEQEKAQLDALVAKMNQSVKNGDVQVELSQKNLETIDDRILALRKEILKEIRALEDTVADLGYRIQRLEKTVNKK